MSNLEEEMRKVVARCWQIMAATAADDEDARRILTDEIPDRETAIMHIVGMAAGANHVMKSVGYDPVTSMRGFLTAMAADEAERDGDPGPPAT